MVSDKGLAIGAVLAALFLIGTLVAVTAAPPARCAETTADGRCSAYGLPVPAGMILSVEPPGPVCPLVITAHSLLPARLTCGAGANDTGAFHVPLSQPPQLWEVLFYSEASTTVTVTQTLHVVDA